MRSEKFKELSFEDKLKFCSYLRNVSSLPNRTICEFGWFVNESIWGSLKHTNKFYDKEHGRDNGTFEGWINAFVRYCIKEYNATKDDYEQFKLKFVKK